MPRKKRFKTLPVSLLLACLISPLAAQAGKKPNIILIMADDFGWRDTSVYGSTFYETPHLDAFAASGMRFTDAYAANARCSPTRCGVLTGQYPVRTGLTNAEAPNRKLKKHLEIQSTSPNQRAAPPTHLNYLDPKYHTLGEAMRDAGYATSFFGKWHLGVRPEHFPENHGFEFVKGGRAHAGPPGADRRRSYFPPWKDCETLDSDIPRNTHVDDYLTTLAIDYMREHKDKPFFMCFWPYSVHGPFQSKPALIEKWKKKADPANPQHSPTMAAMIEVLDTAVGNLLKGLEDLGLAEQTIVIFTSDNGGNMYEGVDGTTATNNFPLRGGKAINYEGGVRVPLMVRAPGITPPGSLNGSVISSVDFYPTILQLAGLPPRPEDHKDGVSFVAALKGAPFDRGPTICDEPNFTPATHGIPNTSIRIGEWKMYRYWFGSPDQTHRHELYHLNEDLGEKHDLAAKQPERIAAMSKALDDYYAKSGVLTYHPNEAYNHRTVGSWSAALGNGVIELRDGALRLQSDKPGFSVESSCSPHLSGGGGSLVFRGRSLSKTTIRLFWASTGQRDFADSQSKEIPLSEQWQERIVPLDPLQGMLKNLKLSLTTAGGAELKDIRILTKDGSEFMRYPLF